MKEPRKGRKGWWGLVGVLVVVTVVVTAFWCTFGYSSVCTRSGKRQSSTEWQIPFTDLGYCTWSSTSDTPLSKVVEGRQLVSGCTHAWTFMYGGGNGVTCAIGEGRHLYPAIMSAEVADFLDSVAAYRGREAAREWLAVLLDPQRSRDAARAIQICDLPAKGFENKERFETWWKGHERELKGFWKGASE